MAVTVTFNFTDGQQTRIVAARDAFNQANGTSLSNKQYLLRVIKETVRAQAIQAQMESAIATAQAQVEAAVDTDLVGNA